MAIASSLLYFLLSTGLVGNVESSTDLNPMDIFVLIDSNICPLREHLDRCHAHCQRNCTNFHLDTPCPDVCVKGCVCDEGFARDLTGTCVRLYDCLRSEDECPSGEHYDQCTGHCERNCTTATPDCFGYCISGCVCDEGTVRGSNGKCIPSSQCDAFFPGLVQCPMREHYSECHAHCQKNCTNLRQHFKCSSDCVGGCVCDTGLVRGVDGQCVRRDECPVIDRCPKGEHFEQCDAACERNCTNWIHQILPCSDTCVPGCVCNNGTVRGPDGQCIKPIKCSKAALRVQELPSCGVNEQFSGCKAMCQKNCTNWDKFVPCPRICVPGCVCQEGFVRGPEGDCIVPEQCSYTSQEVLESDRRSCGVNEEYSGCAMRNCQEDCSGWYKFMPCPPFCLGGCVCITGTIRGPNGKCIPRNECPPDSQRRFFEIAPPSCPRNEEYTLCDGNCQRTCENKNREMNCPLDCLGGCVCKRGLFRGPDGKCVPPGRCPAQEETTTGYFGEYITWDQNEYTTEDYDSAMSTTYATEEFITTEEPRRFVFLGDSCPRNEEYTPCDGNCQKTCENKDKGRVCLPECHGGCICKEGLFRAPNGKCVAPEKCPTQKTTAEYLAAEDEDYAYTTEDYALSTMSTYETEEFSTTDEPEVTSFDLKNSVSLEEDSSRQCIAGQHYSPCHSHCQRSCQNYDVRFVCPNLCQAGCVCDRGLVKDDGGQCVKPRECPARRTSNIHQTGSSCPPGEQLSRCKAHCEKTCDNYENDLMCPSVCISGCTCGWGQVRNRDGQCVHPTKCLKRPHPKYVRRE